MALELDRRREYARKAPHPSTSALCPARRKELSGGPAFHLFISYNSEQNY